MGVSFFILQNFLYIITMYIHVRADSSYLKDENRLSEIDSSLQPGEGQLSRESQIQELKNRGMIEAELFYNLTNAIFPVNNCTDILDEIYVLYHGRINRKYKKASNINVTAEKNDYEENLKKHINDSLQFYKNNDLEKYMPFEDYFAIYYYTQNGYVHLEKNSHIGRRMRNAFYRLAIVQSANPEKYFRSILFHGQFNNLTWYEEHLSVEKKEYQFREFHATTTSKYCAIWFAYETPENVTPTVYEMHFARPLLVANLENISVHTEEYETVLLPGTKFFINDWIRNDSFYMPENYTLDLDLVIKLTHDDENMNLFEQQKRVMSELKKLRESGTQFYVKSSLKSGEEQLLSRESQIKELKNRGMAEAELFYNLTNAIFSVNNCTDIAHEMCILYDIEKIGDKYDEHMNASYEDITAEKQNYKKSFIDSVNSFFENYNQDVVYSYMPFEDYFVIVSYTMSNKAFIEKDSDFGRRMRNAFYRLAIVQSADPEKYFHSTLFHGQSNYPTWYEEHLSIEKKKYQFEKFHPASTSKTVAIESAFNEIEENMAATVYEMHFPRPLLAVNLEHISEFGEKYQTVLLPGTKFFINDWNKNDSSYLIAENNGSNVDLVIKLTHDDENMNLFEQQKRVMSEIKKLREFGTQYYLNC